MMCKTWNAYIRTRTHAQIFNYNINYTVSYVSEQCMCKLREFNVSRALGTHQHNLWCYSPHHVQVHTGLSVCSCDNYVVQQLQTTNIRYTLVHFTLLHALNQVLNALTRNVHVCAQLNSLASRGGDCVYFTTDMLKVKSERWTQHSVCVCIVHPRAHA